MGRWVEVAAAAEIAPGSGRTVAAGDLRIAVFNEDGFLFAIDDACPHQGASLGEGLLHAGRVICPWHSWVFDIRTGQCPRDSHEPVQTFGVRTVDGRIEVEVPA